MLDRTNLCQSSMLFNVVIFAILFANVGATCVQPNAASCPARCECDAVEVVCGDLKLIRVPDNLPNNVRTLDLSRNTIRSLQVSDFAGCSSLETIDLSYNSLQRIDRGVFNSTYNLQHLTLSHNYLQRFEFDSARLSSLKLLDLSVNALRLSTLPISTFRGLNKLEVLILTANSWQEDLRYNDRLFISLKNLKILKLDGLPNEVFREGFAALTLLDELYITGGLNIITNETFAVFRTINLTTLSIETENYLVWMDSMSFAHFKCLKSLDLSHNSNLTLKTASNAWFGLQYTQIKELRLGHVTPRNRTTEELDESFFTHLNLTNMTVLELEGNNLAFAKPVFSKFLPNLERLDLANNQLVNPIDLADDIANLTRLITLQVSYQNCPSWKNNRHSSDSARKSRSERDGVVSTSRCKTYYTKDCRKLAVRNNDAHAYNWQTHQQLSQTNAVVNVPLAPSLEVIDLFSGLYFESRTIPSLNFTRGGSKLQLLDLGENGLSTVQGPIAFENPPESLFVDLSYNEISTLNPKLFKMSDQRIEVKVTQLYLTSNNLGYQLQRDVEGSIFSHYHFLTFLELNNNGISHLNAKSFQNLTELQVLILSGNVLRRVDFDFRHMTKLSLLDLSYNEITSFNSTLMQNFAETFSKNPGQLSLSLYGNPIQCSCDTLSFLHWMNQNRESFSGFEITSCLYYDESVNFSRLQEYILVELDYVCWNSVAVIVSGTMLSLAVVLIAASAFCFRYRWEIRYACIKLTQKGQRYQRLENEAVNYTYDAFVVYDSRDHKWVNEELAPHLEDDLEGESQRRNNAELPQLSQQVTRNLRLCIHERDFQPGDDILGNIWCKMEKSRKVILIISRNFTLSHYCEYELNLARMQSFEQGRNVIVPVVLEMPDMDKVSDCLSWLMRKVTYIEWPQYENDRDEFWNKLYETLVDRE